MTSTRLLAAIVGLLLVLPLVAFGGVPGTTFVVFSAMVIALGEYAQMAFPDDVRYSFYWLCLSSLPLAAASLWASGPQAMAFAGLLVVLTMTQVTLTPDESLSETAERLARLVLGVVWIGGLFPFLIRLRGFEGGFSWVLLAMVIAWMGDTGAYFGGRAMGRTPLHPIVSPKKTWEGLGTGTLATLIGVVVMKLTLLKTLTLIDCLGLGLIGSAVAVLGDLSESLLKRAHDVKDSGWIVPGHGGMLDRVDSLLFVAPTVYAWAVIFKGL
jgi:phosphatidate cytidylyltransferase